MLSDSTNKSARFGGAARSTSSSGIFSSGRLLGIHAKCRFLIEVGVDRQQRAMEGVRCFQQDAKDDIVVRMFLVLEGENASERYLKVDGAVGRFGGGGVGVRAGGRHAVDGELERRGCDAVLVEYSDGTAPTLVEGGSGIDFAPIGTDGKFRLGRWALLLLEFAALVVKVVVK